MFLPWDLNKPSKIIPLIFSSRNKEDLIKLITKLYRISEDTTAILIEVTSSTKLADAKVVADSLLR